MYSRNCGSNWPSSGALIACSTRGWALIGPGPISRRCGGFRSSKKSTMRMLLQPVVRDVDSARNPDFFVFHIFNEFLKGFESSGFANQATVQPDRHHAPALGVEDVEGILEVLVELLAGVEALRRGEAHVVRVQRVGH